ncbi:sensor histidine kinase [Lysobacter antibioticus]|uniref:sensor histidine kinase n=1 Tax=Lysobacter antibioticus TaxID=84531 RepID=UPI0011873A44|nr:histidine kinase [Lysobacter antibioticus]
MFRQTLNMLVTAGAVLKRIPAVFWMVIIWWTGYAIVFAAQIVRMSGPEGMSMSWPQALHFGFGSWMMWVPVTLGLYWLVRRSPIERGRILRSLAILLGASLLTVLLRAAYVYATSSVFHWFGHHPRPGFMEVLTGSLSYNLMLAWVVIGMAHALVFYHRSMDRGRQIARLQEGLTTAKLEALRAQMNPHFLFNALNSVAEMVHRDPELADRMLVSLSLLLQEGLSVDRVQFRPLREEIELINSYLMIEKVRLSDRLKVEWSVETAALDVSVPALILQPLVENAVVHGISRRRAPSVLGIGCELRGETLVVEVSNCVSPDGAAPHGSGIGLGSARSRLQLLYGGRATIRQCSTESGRYLVRITVPTGKYGAASLPGESPA